MSKLIEPSICSIGVLAGLLAYNEFEKNNLKQEDKMSKRINIDGVWYVQEESKTVEKNTIEEVAHSINVSLGAFEFATLTEEDGTIIHNSQWVTHLNNPCIDVKEYIVKVRDGRHDASDMSEYSECQMDELRQLLLYVTEKGLLQ